MTLDEFIASNPTREQIAWQICAVANYNVLDLTSTFLWKPLSELGGFKKEDFWDDKKETIAKMGEQAITHYGIVNYKLKQ
jgi:hypothetical protein